jgi:hypothetical protein
MFGGLRATIPIFASVALGGAFAIVSCSGASGQGDSNGMTGDALADGAAVEEALDSGKLIDATDAGTVVDATTTDAANDAGPDVRLDASFDASGVPAQHRPTPTVCAAPPHGTFDGGYCGGDPEGGPPVNVHALCTTDSDCTLLPNGRCNCAYPRPQDGGGWGGATSVCEYPECTTDSDCAPGRGCLCGAFPEKLGGNGCVSGWCRVDSDCMCPPGGGDGSTALHCGVPGYCSPNLTDVVFPLQWELACHTPADTCLSTSDCPSPLVCYYSYGDAHWGCRHYVDAGLD